MQLESFTVTNFRSVMDSGEVQVARITALLGRNESGKSNLLRALASLNPPEGFQSLNPVKDFPRHRRLQECTDDTPVVSSRWRLDPPDQQQLAAIHERAGAVTHVQIGRRYGKDRWVTFEALADERFDEGEVRSKIRKIVPAIRAAGVDLEAGKKAALDTAADTFETAIAVVPDRTKWAQNALAALKALRTALAGSGSELSDKQDQHVIDLEELAAALAGEKQALTKARDWVLANMPVFMFLDEYPELHGHQNIAEYLSRKGHKPQSEADRSFEKLCKVAGLDPTQLQDLLSKNEHETRNQLANRAGALVTSEIKRLWKDRPLKVRFNLDAQHLDTLVSDPNAIYDVEVNLDERSRGFQWFFAFYIAFSADTQGGAAEKAVLLLDEPGLYLHAKSQADLLAHFQKDFKNQIVYTTHSPFMVPTHALDWVRTVNIAEDKGTTVSNDPKGDTSTLFPLQAALGYSLAQSLFVGPNNLVVEGVADFWVLSAVSGYLAEHGGSALNPDLTLTPAGGAQKVSYMVALLTSEELNVLVLLDKESEAEATRTELIKSKLIAENNVVLLSEAFGVTPPTEADTEDLLDPDVYESLVRESYAKELKGKTLTFNAKIPRIAKRAEAAFEALGIPFHKTRPARLFLTKMASAPKDVLPDHSRTRFEALFKIVNDRLNKHQKRDATPFR